ncbi:MAG: hypothetical protein ACR2NA_06380 [Solirubrobacterales bacterium]
MAGDAPRIEYVEARRVLLDALDALRSHLDAVVLVGAQAVYLRTASRIESYQPFTTDADVVVDPALLGPIPPLGEAMLAGGFALTDEPGIWEARFMRPGFDDEIVVPVDLIVPEELAPRAGRRAARLPGEHGKATARKSSGLAGAVVDNGPLELVSLEGDDPRAIMVNVAGFGALLVAKLHKLGDRLATPERLHAKDAGDVYRLFDAIAPDDLTTILQALLEDPRSTATTVKALAYLDQLFITPAAVGVRLAVEALRGILPESTVSAAMTAYAGELRRAVDRR